MTRQELQVVRAWADAQIAAGQDPTWVWYQYMKLREALDGIIAGMECAALQADAGMSFGPRVEGGPQLVVSNDKPEGPQRQKLGSVIDSLPRKFGV